MALPVDAVIDQLVAAAETKLVDAIPMWEVGMLVAKQRVRLDRPVETWVSPASRAGAGIGRSGALLATGPHD